MAKLSDIVMYTHKGQIIVEKFDPKKTYPKDLCQFDEALSFLITDLKVNKIKLINYICNT